MGTKETPEATTPSASVHEPVEGRSETTPVNRRAFLGGLGGLSAAALASSTGLATMATVGATPAEADEVAPIPAKFRRNKAFLVRLRAARDERRRAETWHPCNGDEHRFPNRIGNFSKTLPHNDLGEVDPAAYDALLDALDTGDFADMEAVPQGGRATLLNPLGGLTFSIFGPDSPGVGVKPPPSIASAEFAAQMAELYWMALLRDVPFSAYDTDPMALAARADLASFSGYTGPRDPVTGEIRANDLFRTEWPGVQDGPMESQFLLSSFRYDGIPITPMISTAAPGIDLVTYFPEWLNTIRGFPNGNPPPDPRDPTLRFPRNARDLGRTAGQDTIYSQYFKAQVIINGTFGFGGGAARDDANPYKTSTRQAGFATFGLAHIVELIGKAHKSERHAWYQKWNVHRFLRPDAGGARVHNVKTGAAGYPIHPDLINNSTVLDAIFDHNRQQNLARLGIDEGTYLLPMLFGNGSPSHPAFPAGHAISAGACVTMLKAFYKEDTPFPNPKMPTPDGLGLVDYVPGVDGPPLTLGGELNKLAHNLSFGRDMSGVHWRVDNIEGDQQGEEVAIRMLREELATYPEPFGGFTLTKFDGSTITIDD